jgi:hypothetical protein
MMAVVFGEEKKARPRPRMIRLATMYGRPVMSSRAVVSLFQILIFAPGHEKER